MESKNNISNLVEFIHQGVKNKPHNIAYENLGTTLTYDEFYHKARHIGAYFSKIGVKPGDRVAIMLPNVLQQPIVTLAALMQGATIVNVNPLYTPRELTHQINDSGAQHIIILENMALTLEKSLPNIALKNIIVSQIGDCFPQPKRLLINAVIKYIKRMVPPYQLPKVLWLKDSFETPIGQWQEHNSKVEDIAFLQYTGGTTGVSKGAMLTHGNLLANIHQAETVMPKDLYKEPSTILTALPLYHIFALTVSLITLGNGGCNLLVTNPRDIPKLIDLLKKRPVQGIPILNTLMNALLQHPEFKNIDFSSLRATISGGMATLTSTAKKWHQVTGCVVQQGYGLSETSPVVALTKHTKEFAPNVGKPVPNTDIIIVDESGEKVEEGAIGELCVKGPQVMQGYWNREDETKKSFTKDGYFKTGDIAKILKNGSIKLIDRKKDIIIVSGFNVYPSEIEDILSLHEEIVEAGVIGVKDKDGNEHIKAFIVPTQPKLDLDSIDEHCHNYLTGYKVPKDIEMVNALPKTNIGKVLRRVLREQPNS
ncbi:MAG TPA: AMP-binding protein [Gammaproteobacteria bacterium]|nr:AMP-binding protein [Gammaproteobacteria bacterium]